MGNGLTSPTPKNQPNGLKAKWKSPRQVDRKIIHKHMPFISQLRSLPRNCFHFQLAMCNVNKIHREHWDWIVAKWMKPDTFEKREKFFIKICMLVICVRHTTYLHNQIFDSSFENAASGVEDEETFCDWRVGARKLSLSQPKKKHSKNLMNITAY